ncbi:MAG: hypothetical protein H6Q36_1461 [Chloroflexi bacterium]|nr:hypothetical protein [Chloroflexota bacterium]
MRRLAGSIALIVIVAAACTSAATVSPLSAPTTSPAPSAVVTPSPVAIPTATQPPSSVPIPSPTATATPVSISDLAWQRVTTLDGAALGGDIVGFAGGYIVTSDDKVFWSADGTEWTAVTIGSRVADIASDGRTVLLAGAEERDCGPDPCEPGSTGCGGPVCKASPVAWRSVDGLSWERSKPWPVAAVDSDAYRALETALWSVPTGGWDAVLSYLTGDTSNLVGVFHSDDGLTWVALPADLPASIGGSAEEPFWGPGAADETGRRLLAGWVFAGDSVQTSLFTSPDGGSWTWLEDFPEPGLMVSAVLASSAGGSPLWSVAGTGAIDPGDDSGRPTVWTSPDLAFWSGQTLAMGDSVSGWVSALSPATFGYVAVGRLVLAPETDPVDMSWASADGVDAWIPLAVPTEPGVQGPSVVADGPAGVIGIRWADDSGDEPVPAIVWALR